MAKPIAPDTWLTPVGGIDWDSVEALLDGDEPKCDADEDYWTQSQGSHFWGTEKCPLRRTVAACLEGSRTADRAAAVGVKKDALKKMASVAWPYGGPLPVEKDRKIGSEKPKKSASGEPPITAIITGVVSVPNALICLLGENGCKELQDSAARDITAICGSQTYSTRLEHGGRIHYCAQTTLDKCMDVYKAFQKKFEQKALALDLQTPFKARKIPGDLSVDYSRSYVNYPRRVRYMRCGVKPVHHDPTKIRRPVSAAAPALAAKADSASVSSMASPSRLPTRTAAPKKELTEEEKKERAKKLQAMKAKIATESSKLKSLELEQQQASPTSRDDIISDLKKAMEIRSVWSGWIENKAVRRSIPDTLQLVVLRYDNERKLLRGILSIKSTKTGEQKQYCSIICKTKGADPELQIQTEVGLDFRARLKSGKEAKGKVQLPYGEAEWHLEYIPVG